MESDSSTSTQHSVMLHASTPRVKEELSVIDQSPETMNNARVSPSTPGEMQSTEMIVQYCARTYKTDSQHVDIDEYFPRVKLQRMSQDQINTYCKQIRNHSILQQPGKCIEDFHKYLGITS